MGIELNAGEFTVNHEFNCRLNKQKLLIDVLLKYTKINLDNLATMLRVPVWLLQDVWKGGSYLKHDAALRLTQYFLLFFGE